MREVLESMKEITFCDTVVTVRSAVHSDNEAALKALAEELAE